MDIYHVFPSHIKGNLSYRFEKGRAFDITHRTADFGNNDVYLSLCMIYSVLNFVGNVRNNLNGCP